MSGFATESFSTGIKSLGRSSMEKMKHVATEYFDFESQDVLKLLAHFHFVWIVKILMEKPK